MPEIVAEAEMVPVVGSRGCDIALTLPAASVALAANTYVPVSRTFWVCFAKIPLASPTAQVSYRGDTARVVFPSPTYWDRKPATESSFAVC
jgi:hypothetical protein